MENKKISAEYETYPLKSHKVRGMGLEPTRRKTQEPKSCASTIPPLAHQPGKTNRARTHKQEALMRPNGPESHLTESNCRPSHYEWDALPTELKWQVAREAFATRAQIKYYIWIFRFCLVRRAVMFACVLVKVYFCPLLWVSWQLEDVMQAPCFSSFLHLFTLWFLLTIHDDFALCLSVPKIVLRLKTFI